MHREGGAHQRTERGQTGRPSTLESSHLQRLWKEVPPWAAVSHSFSSFGRIQCPVAVDEEHIQRAVVLAEDAFTVRAVQLTTWGVFRGGCVQPQPCPPGPS